VTTGVQETQGENWQILHLSELRMPKLYRGNREKQTSEIFSTRKEETTAEDVATVIALAMLRCFLFWRPHGQETCRKSVLKPSK